MNYRIKTLLEESFGLSPNLKIDEECGLPQEAWYFMGDFIAWCQQHLKLENVPKIHICSNRENGMTTGAYDPQSSQIFVYGKGRALVDIMRTLAHELSHHNQRLQDRIKSTKRDWNLEGEADANAGKMVFTFAHSQPQRMKIYDI
jgi:hypothetical protein